MITYSSFNFGSEPGSMPATFGASSVSRFTALLVRSVPTSGNFGSGWFSVASFMISSMVWPLPAKNLSPPRRVMVIATFWPADSCSSGSASRNAFCGPRPPAPRPTRRIRGIAIRTGAAGGRRAASAASGAARGGRGFMMVAVPMAPAAFSTAQRSDAEPTCDFTGPGASSAPVLFT